MARQRKDWTETIEYGGVAVEDGPQQPQTGAQAPAACLLAYLKDTGTPDRTLHRIEDWLHAPEHADATADALYRWLSDEAEGFNPGTVRKAGKWAFGPTFEPAAVVEQAPADELLRLRQENEVLRGNVATLSAEKLGLTQANAHLRDRLNTLQGQVRYLSLGKTPNELEAAGVDPTQPSV